MIKLSFNTHAVKSMTTTGTGLDRYRSSMSPVAQISPIGGGADHVSAWQLADHNGSFVAVTNYG
jgi:hypothetical protein